MAMLQGPLPMTTVASSSPGAWELEAALGRAKLFLIGSPYASDFCFSDAIGGPLQVWHATETLLSLQAPGCDVSVTSSCKPEQECIWYEFVFKTNRQCL